MFSTKHFIWLGLCALAVLLGLAAAEKKRIPLKTAGMALSVISILSEFCKMMTHMLPSPMGGYALDPNALPFHLCSMQIFIILYITFAGPSPTRDKAVSFSVPAALLGGGAALLIPTDGVSFSEPLTYQFFVYHAGLVWLALYLIRTRQVNLGRRAYVRNLLILLCLAGAALEINGAFYAYGTNFLFLTRPPLEGLPLLNLNHGWYAYLLTLAALAAALLTLVHLPFLIAERAERSRSGAV